MLQRPIFNSLLIILVFILCPFLINAQIKPGVKQSAVSFSDISSPSDLFTAYYNPAASKMFQTAQVATYYSPSPYGLSELRQFGLTGLYPIDGFNICAGIYNYGFKLYNETYATANVSLNAMDNLIVGASITAQNLHIERYGNSTAFRLDLGGIVIINDYINASFSGINLLGSEYSGSENSVPKVFRTGISLKPFEGLKLHALLEAEETFAPDLRVGWSYEPHQNIVLRNGYSRSNGEFSIGGSILFSGISFDYSYAHHKYLGSTHIVGLAVPDVIKFF